MLTSFRAKKVALAAGAGALSVALLGGAALAAFAPVAGDPGETVAGLDAVAATNKAGDKLKAILDALVAKGLITRAQADAIVAAIRDAEPTRDGGEVRRAFGNLLEESAKYLGLTVAELKAKLPGTSLAALADKAAGKSRTGLVTTLQNAVNAAIEKALAAKKITKEHADKAKADAPTQIAKFVDHVYAQSAPRPKTTAREPKVGQFLSNALATASGYLGLSQRETLAALREGKSLGEIASTTTGKSKDGLVGVLANAANARIDRARTDGKLTVDQAAALKAQIGSAVLAFVDGKVPRPFKR